MKNSSSENGLLVLSVLVAAVCCGIAPILLGAVGLGTLGFARTAGLAVGGIAVFGVALAWALRLNSGSSGRRDRSR